ncbi:hypothetical protein [Mycobacterium sp.]|uniref:hypothetical protein n=1 Tax=Mycobacterium sp. TaxID=1785 RepID=UPI003C793026
MTDMPDDLPSPDEFRRKMAHVDREFVDARRYLSALCAEDNQALGALMVEIHRSGRAMNVLAATAVLALDFAHLSADRLGGNVQKLARRVGDGPGHRRDRAGPDRTRRRGITFGALRLRPGCWLGPARLAGAVAEADGSAWG